MRLPLVAVVALAFWLCTIPAPAGDIPLVTATHYPEATVDEFAGCSFACATTWKLEVSSHLPPENGNRYAASCLEDGAEKTCWASKGPGDWLQWTFAGHGTSWKAPLRGFRTYNGYGKSDEIWRRNSRVRTFLLLVNSTPRVRIRLVDKPGVQSATFPEMTMHPGDRVRLVIEDTFPGSRWTDTCVSEIIPDGAH